MDRLIVYPGAIPLDTDILSVERNIMTAMGWLAQAALGAASGVVGLPCVPTLPASMTVNIGPGALWAQSVMDQNNFGSLPPDGSSLMKMGILAEQAGTNFTLTAPATSGQSINYLIEAAFEESDSNPVVLPYVNPSNPAQPYAGPNNSATSQNTLRMQRVALQLKAGPPANTGTQATPAVDVGYVGLYVITVNYGQTNITGPDITLYPGAPFTAGPFAPLAGDASQTFAVAPATQPTQAPQLGQMLNVIEVNASTTITISAQKTIVFCDAATPITLTIDIPPAAIVAPELQIYSSGGAEAVVISFVGNGLEYPDATVVTSIAIPINTAWACKCVFDGTHWRGNLDGATVGDPANTANMYTTLGQFQQPITITSGAIPVTQSNTITLYPPVAPCPGFYLIFSSTNTYTPVQTGYLAAQVIANGTSLSGVGFIGSYSYQNIYPVAAASTNEFSLVVQPTNVPAGGNIYTSQLTAIFIPSI